MESTPKQQILRTLKDAKNILLLSHQQIDGDGIGAMIALYLAFQKMGKQATAFSFDPVPGALDFLPRIKDYLHNEINSFNDFIITIDCSNTKVDKIKYNAQDNKVNIIVTPKDGNFSGSDISTAQGKGQYDCIIVLDTGDIQQIGKIYKDNPKLFYDVPVINIDHHVTNTFFGTVNLVDPKSTSTCEIILGILEALESQTKTKLLDSTIATYLLTGITVDTGSFQNSNTTPKAFSVAAQLLALGADQQTIIKNLYKTHKLSKLKLWGHALSHIKEDKETNLVWSSLSRQDFTDAEASDDEVEGVIDELITSAPGADIVFLLRERNDGVVACSIRTLDATDASRLAMLFNGGGHKRAAGFKIKGDTLEKIENFVVKKFRDYKKGLIELPSESRKENIGDEGAPFETAVSPEAQSFISQVQKESENMKAEETKEAEEAKNTQNEFASAIVTEEIISEPEVSSPTEEKQEETHPTIETDVVISEPILTPEIQKEPSSESIIDDTHSEMTPPHEETIIETAPVQTQYTASPQEETPEEPMQNFASPSHENPFVQTPDMAPLSANPIPDIPNPHATDFIPTNDFSNNSFPPVQTQFTATPQEAIPEEPMQNIATPSHENPFVQTPDMAPLSPSIPMEHPIPEFPKTPSFTNSEDAIPDFQAPPPLPSEPINSNDDSSDPFSRPSLNR